MKRILVLFGAGASIAYGAPSTPDLTQIIENDVVADRSMKLAGGDLAYLKVRDTLTAYLTNPGVSISSRSTIAFTN
jgi:hypothetical protein